MDASNQNKLRLFYSEPSSRSNSPTWGSEHPFNTFSETWKSAQTSASTLVLYAKNNPNVQKLVTGYEEWESGLRREAKARLGGFKPVQQMLDNGRVEDWALLKKVKTSKPGLGGFMKRSASDSTLTRSDSDGSKNLRIKVYLRQDWDPMSWEDEFAHHNNMMHPTDAYLDERSGLYANETITRNLEAVAVSIQNTLVTAQQTIQETANNCQQNLQTLGALFQQAAPLPSGNALVKHIVSAATDKQMEPNPWAVVPFYLRVREMSSGAEDQSKEKFFKLSKDGNTWFEQLSEYFDRLDSKRQKLSLNDPGRHLAIVTTASLPWMTGTSVNPLLRAAYLSTDSNRSVTLVIPWLSQVDQAAVFPNSMSFDTPEQQEAYVREWAKMRTGLDCDFKVTFYPGRYAPEKGSILPVGDITEYIPDHEADVAVLEEPEHLTWYHHGQRWTDKFKHVVGVMHTNYLDYARREENGAVKEFILKHVNALMCRIHCHKVVKLSDAVQPLPRQETMFVHGVSPAFLEVGKKKAQMPSDDEQLRFPKGAYFLGKVVWAKGYTELIHRLKEHAERTGEQLPVDVYGSGPDLPAVQEAAQQDHLALTFNGAKDHADTTIQDYKVFINPSLSDVVATTTAEALAMGKYVVCAEHPSNHFFKQFPNCLIYRNSEEFSKCLKHAMESEPQPLSPSDLQKLTWEAATERFLEVAELRKDPDPLEKITDKLLFAGHNTLTGIEPLRIMAGAGENTRDNPLSVSDYQPSLNNLGGWFDDKNRARRVYTAIKVQ